MQKEELSNLEIQELLLRQAKHMTSGRIFTEASITKHAKNGFERIKGEKFFKLIDKAKMMEKRKITSLPHGREFNERLRSEINWLLKQVFSGLRT